jgi:ssDNA-binding Zn-finger/Zn-ribbon topoisomerase 1
VDLIILVFIVFLFFILLTVFKLKMKQQKPIEENGYPYQRLDALFTPAERSFFGVLNQAVGEDVVVFGKVRVADVITPKKGGVKGAWQKAFNKISAKHFDFIICNKSDLSFVCGVELDDNSHNSAKQKIRDAFLEDACKSAGFPLIRVPAKSAYSVNDIRDSLSVFFPEFQEKETIPSLETETETEKMPKLCPKCSSEMRLKVAKKGKSVGSEFWACSAFPKCRNIESSIHTS